MRIEKISNNQIKCVLEKDELLSRHINVSELAYGSEKAQELFQDMMKQASYEFGFESANAPLMIEAVPLSGEGIMLIITKVDNPDELETKLVNLPGEGQEAPAAEEEALAEEVLSEPAAEPSAYPAEEDEKISAFFVYSFPKLDHVSRVAAQLVEFPFDKSRLYKTPAGDFVFFVSSEAIGKDACKVVRGILSEYGEAIHCRRTRLNHFDEHYEILIKENALRILGTL